jgi:hypothetical protein
MNYFNNTEVKNGGDTPSLPYTPSWHNAELIKQSDNFTFSPFDAIYIVARRSVTG